LDAGRNRPGVGGHQPRRRRSAGERAAGDAARGAPHERDGERHELHGARARGGDLRGEVAYAHGVTEGPPRLYAHRGAAAELPENTLPAFARALELSADAIETDAHLTKDGHIVLSHDATGERMCGKPIAIARATLAEVREWDAGATFRDRSFSGKG